MCPLASAAVTVGNDEDSVSSVGSIDGASWNNKWLDGISCRLKIVDDFPKDEELLKFIYLVILLR
jgi:hypothetical protein